MLRRSLIRPLTVLLGVALYSALLVPAQAQADLPAIAGASDLKFALDEIAAKFRADTGREVKLVYGSSGNFATQIQNGAPFQMFLSADEGFVFRLADAGKTLQGSRGELYAIGRIVLLTPTGSSLRADAELNDLRAALKDGRLKRFAIANPEHAPYGRAAEEALRHRGLWEAVKPTLVLGENISQTAQFATSGSAQGGIIALSLVKAPEIGRLGSFALLPDTWHQPLRQRMVLLANAGETAKAFYAHVSAPAARAIFIRYGFTLPGESS